MNSPLSSSTPMELRRLRYFIAVAEELNFSRAAQRLNMAQPPLSVQIKQLEVALGVLLFERTSRGVLLTDAGRLLLVEARQIVTHLDHAFRSVRRAGLGQRERLTIGFIPSATNASLPHVLHEFNERNPNVDLYLREMPTSDVVQFLTAKQIDIGLLYLPFAASSLVTRAISRESIVLALPEYHRLAASESVLLEQIADEPIILPDRDQVSGLHDQVVGACLQAGFEPSVVHADVWLQQTMIGLVAGGMGIALVPASVKNLNRRGVKFLPVHDLNLEVDLGLIWRQNDLPDAAKAFVDVAAEFVAPQSA